MEHQPVANPTCALKVNIQCCTGCRVKAKKKLQKLNGVDSITYDTEQGVVRISGNVDPTVLVHEFAKLGKKAEILSLAVQNAKTNDQLITSSYDDNDDGGAPPPKTHNESIPNNRSSSKRSSSTKKRFWCFTTKNKEVKTSSSNVDGGANVSSKFPVPAVATNWHFPATATPMPGYGASGQYYLPPMHSTPMPLYGRNGPMLPPLPYNGFLRSRPPRMMNPKDPIHRLWG
ncbi:hypothetical protein ACOSP7_001579 [Xanthoceras sorbifolium]